VRKQALAWIITISAIVAIIYMISSDRSTNSTQPQAVNGILDLRNTTEAKNNNISLSGEWLFVPNEFTKPGTFTTDSVVEMVPGPWKSNAEYGTYQLKMYLPEDLEEVGFRVRNIWSAHTLYVNGQQLSKYGEVGKSKETTVPVNTSYEVYTKVTTNELIVTLHVANFYNARSGIIFPIDFGNVMIMKDDVHQDYTLEWMAIFILIIFGLFHFTIFLIRKKDDAYFFSGLYFLSLAVLVMTRGERLLLRKFPSISFDLYFTIQDVATYGSGLLLLFFLRKIEPKLISTKWSSILFAPVYLYIVALLLLPARSVSSMQTVFLDYLNIVFLGFIIRIAYLTLKRKSKLLRNEAINLMIIILFLFLFSISGTFDQLFFSGKNIFNRLGLLGYVISMNVFLAVRMMNRTTEAERLNDNLRQVIQVKDEILAILSYEMKAPLHGVHSLINDIRKSSIQLFNRNQLNQLIVIEETTEKLTYLVNDLQDFTRMRFNELQLNMVTVDLRMIIDHVARLVDSDFIYKDISFINEIPDSTYVLADENRFRQVVFNVLNHAIKSTSNGQIIASYQIVNDEIYLFVVVTSEGMDPEMVQQIFSVREFADSAEFLYKHEQVIGIGLFISKELINRMNGRIWVEATTIGKGTTLGIALQHVNRDEDLNIKNHDSLNLAKNLDRLEINHNLRKVLIVDDDSVHIEVLKAILANSYTVIVAFSGKQALMILEEYDISYVITDMMMPGMSGIELTRRIRDKYSLMELPVIITMLSDSPKDVEILFQAGANDYLTKPFKSEVVLSRLNAVQQIKDASEEALAHELAFLQAQIKPHFLYNALSSIISFCYSDGERAAHLLTMLSSYLRYMFDAGRDGLISTLQEELDVIDAYVEIERARFGDRLTYSREICEEIQTKDIHLPSLLIQPLIENAIRHGLFNKEGNGHVQLTIYSKEKFLFIEVEDDGVGMTDDIVSQLLSEEISSKGIGFSNVFRRIRKIRGGDLQIISKKGKGTKLTVMIPIGE